MSRSGLRFVRRAAALSALLLVVWVSDTAAARAVPAPAGTRLLVLKSRRLLMVIRAGRVVAAWPVSLGGHPAGPKRMEGDGRTPEGDYFIDGRIPDSRFHLSLHLSYPNSADLARAAARHVPPGGDIAIHGRPDNYHSAVAGEWPGDWTDGCVALDNDAIEALARLVDIGTSVAIRP
jgi:murein L,D-transpeptidase YafK